MSNETLIGSVNKGNEAFFIADYLKKNNKCSLLYIARNEKEIFDIKSKIEWLIPTVEILIYRSWDQIPYDSVSPSREIQSERINTLYKIYHNKNQNIVISSVNAILQKTINVDFIKNNFIEIFLNKKINFEQLINKLIFLGYQRTSVVREKSEFAIRGSIIDIFLSDRIKPIRIDFFDQNIETISEFDRLTQKTTKKIDENILITPSSELLIYKCDILIPAALENAITLQNVDKIQAKLICEAANGPVSYRADKKLQEKGTAIIPDIYANGGGVTVSYFEWIRNISHIRMGRLNKRYEEHRGDTILKALNSMSPKKLSPEIIDQLIHGADEGDLIASGLEDTMRVAFQEILERKLSLNLPNYRTAAYIIALKKIEKSFLELGL